MLVSFYVYLCVCQMRTSFFCFFLHLSCWRHVAYLVFHSLIFFSPWYFVLQPVIPLALELLVFLLSISSSFALHLLPALTTLSLSLSLCVCVVDVEHSNVRFLGNLVLNLWDCGGFVSIYRPYMFDSLQNNKQKNTVKMPSWRTIWRVSETTFSRMWKC